MKYSCTAFLFLFFSFFTVLAANPELRLGTVVIDAGHGGSDPGAVSLDRNTYEKTLTLDIAKRLQQLIKEGYPDVKVVLTRDRDVFVSLNDRAAIANAKDADLFISIHINSSRATAPNAYSVHILGQSSVKNRDLFAYNMDVCRRENSVILLEEDYSTKYQGFDPSDPESFIFMQLMQNANLEKSLEFAEDVSSELTKGPIRANRGVWQDPFYVLWKTSMPAVLVELGFLSNVDNLATLRDPEKRQQFAKCLYSAFCQYKYAYDGSMKPEFQKPDTSAAAVAKSSSVKYGTQIFAASRLLPKNDPSFLGMEMEVIKSGNMYKYVIGLSEEPEAAAEKFPAIRKKYPDAFKVVIKEGAIFKGNF